MNESDNIGAKGNKFSNEESSSVTKHLIPGLNLEVQEKAPCDQNLAPFCTRRRETFQFGDTRLLSVSTDSPDWAPGICQNLYKYEGIFKPKVTVPKQKEPNRTKAAETRKLLARKKREAIKRRKKENEKKQLLRFIPVFTASENKFPCMKEDENESQPAGLKGGAPKAKIHPPKSGHLQLRNRGTDCFVNSVVQLMRQTAYATYIKLHLESLLVDAAPDAFKLSRSLAHIFSDNRKNGPVSTAVIRSIVAQCSGKSYLNNNTQQDAEEFFRALEATLSEELIASEDFFAFRDLHWGQEKQIRKFMDNTETGKCHRCGKSPEIKDNPFLMLKLKNLPRTNADVQLTTLLDAHFSESTDILKMRCSYCCQSQKHESNRITCPQTGMCKARSTVELCQLTQPPEYLFIQLIRNIGNEPKVQTFIEFGNELVLPTGDKYEPVASLDHIGNSPTGGHYITFLKLKEDKWIEYNDDVSSVCSLKNANNRNNYILLFKTKKDTLQPALNKDKTDMAHKKVQRNKVSNYQDDVKSLSKEINDLENKLLKSKEEKAELNKKKKRMRKRRKQSSKVTKRQNCI